MLPTIPGIVLCEVLSYQGLQSTETLLQTQQNVNCEAKTYFTVTILVIALVLFVILIVVCLTCVHKKFSEKNHIEDVSLHPEDVIAKVHHFQRQKVQLVEKLGQGEYGVYWKAIVTGVAGDPALEVQVMAKEAFEQYDQQALLAELKTYVHVGHHVNLLNLLGIVRENMEQGELYVITEYCRFGNLKDFLLQNRYSFREDSSDELLGYQSGGRQTYSRMDLLYWSYQIACGLQYFTSREFVYGNLSARNVLLSEGNIVKLTNFAVPRRGHMVGKLTKTNILSLDHMAPECLEGGTFFSSSDVWSYGVLLWEMFSLGCDPCWDIIPHGNLEYDTQLPKPKYANEEVYQIMRSCCKQDPLARPSFTELAHKFYCMIPSHLLRNYDELRIMYSSINAVDSAIL